MTYTIWGDGDNGITMLPGIDPPKFINGQLIDEVNVILFQYEANTWEEAVQKQKELMGWN